VAKIKGNNIYKGYKNKKYNRMNNLNNYKININNNKNIWNKYYILSKN